MSLLLARGFRPSFILRSRGVFGRQTAAMFHLTLSCESYNGNSGRKNKRDMSLEDVFSDEIQAVIPRNKNSSSRITEAQARDAIREFIKDEGVPSVVSARHQLLHGEDTGRTLYRKQFEKVLKTFIRYGRDEEADFWYSLYTSRRPQFQQFQSIQMCMIEVYGALGKLDKALTIVRSKRRKMSAFERAEYYKELVLVLTRYGRLEEAMSVLEEMGNECLHFLSRRNHSEKTNEMFASLLVACMPPGSNDLGEIWSAHLPKVLSEEELQRRYAYGWAVLRLFEKLGCVVYYELIPVIREWLYCDPVNKWVMKEATFENGVCSACNRALRPRETADESIDKEIEEYFFKYEWNWVENSAPFKKCTNHLLAFLERNGPFDVIIDGMNVGLDSSHFARTSSNTTINFVQIVKAVKYFTSQGKKVLLVTKLFGRSTFLPGTKIDNMIESLPDNCWVFHANTFYDDLLLLRALSWCGGSTVLVTKDSFEDIVTSMPDQFRVMFHKWVKNHVLIYHFKGVKDHEEFCPIGEFHSIGLEISDTSIHFPCTNMLNKCIQKVA